MDKDDEPRYVHLLQPNRDLAANWAVDVARELESYLSGLSSVSISGQDGHDSFNFAEAALLIQGSIQIYSRKVEYLYALVLQALDFIANKKQAQRESSSIQENGKDADIIEDQEEDFLNLDDVPEETNIDIVDENNDSSCITPAVRPPACLIVVEGENVDITGDAGELASYQISTSSLHRDFLLLDPCDAKFVDEYWKENAKSQMARDTGCQSNTKMQSYPSIVESPFPVRDLSGDHGAGPSRTTEEPQSARRSPRIPEQFNDAGDDLHDDGQVHDAWVDNDNDEDEIPDPWVPLNPHEPGTLRVVPFRRGRPNIRRKAKQAKDILLEPAVHLGGAWQALENLEREVWRAKQSEELPPYEKLRSSFVGKRATSISAARSFDGSDEYSDNDGSRSDAEGCDGFQEPEFYHPDAVEDFCSQQSSQQTSEPSVHVNASNVEIELNGESNLEKLCQVQLDAVLKKRSESEKLTELANRVVSWNKKIEKHLATQDARPPFDIHAYGARILERLSTVEDGEDFSSSDVQKPFTQIVAGLEKHEVARTFAALLQLVNNGNVVLEKGTGSSAPECFTAEHPFGVKVLSWRKPHEELLHYRAPSSRQKKSSARKKGKGLVVQDKDIDENLANNFIFGKGQRSFMATSPDPFQVAGKNRRLSVDMEKSTLEQEVMESLSTASPTKSNTPEGKRRRRRQSLKAVQVRVAG